MRKLTEKDYVQAANELGVPVASIKAVTEVEAASGGFYDDGRPKILFERHVMYRLVKDKFGAAKAGNFAASYPEICNPKSGGYGPSIAQPVRMESASKLIDRECALQSASWGLFQIMGYHWKRLGFTSLQAFVNAMYASEGAQLQAFVAFIQDDATLSANFKNRDWTAFAKEYNGPAYDRGDADPTNDYDVKLAAAYKKHGGV